MRINALLIGAFLVLCGCETSRPRIEPPVSVIPEPAQPSDWQLVAKPTAFDQLPGWANTDLAPGLAALRRSCEVFARQGSSQFLSRKATWAGTTDDWTPACAALDVIEDAASARAVIQALFTPVEIIASDRDSRFTGYFEPTYPASRSRVAPFTEPVPARPADLVADGGRVYQHLPSGGRRPYPTRAEITQTGVVPLAYARPGDVFFLQIQGSGRLTLEGGQTLRAVYAAHNGHPFKSTANWLLSKGWIARKDANMRGIRAWMETADPVRVRQAMNANPRFVFFDIEPEGDPSLGPKGSLGVPLTPLGSMAVDTGIHPNGVPMFVQTQAPGLGGRWSGLVVAQDTGGAIKGPVRGDLYFGTGSAAGTAADTVNAPGRLWVLLPRTLAENIRRQNQTRAATSGPIVLTP